MDIKGLCEFCNIVSVATACGPAVKWVKEKLGEWSFHTEEDGFLLAFPPGEKSEDIKILYVAHVDEIGGIIIHPHPLNGNFKTRVIGALPEVFANRPLLAMDYLDEDGSTIRPCRGKIFRHELVVEGKGLQPFKTVFTFNEKAEVKGDYIYGKAIDPRVTAFAVVETLAQVNRPGVALMLIFAEECSLSAGQKGAYFANLHLSSLSLVVNCDVPGLENVQGGEINRCIMRLYEGKGLIDPHFGIRLYDELVKKGSNLLLTSTLTGSQTPIFIPQCHAISLAVPAEEAHVARTGASLSALKSLMDILTVIPDLNI